MKRKIPKKVLDVRTEEAHSEGMTNLRFHTDAELASLLHETARLLDEYRDDETALRIIKPIAAEAIEEAKARPHF